MILILEVGLTKEKFMNCNLKNKTIALIALSFMVVMAMNNVSFAAEKDSLLP